MLRLAAVDDAGTIVNPLLAEGQVVGGSAQGIGQRLVEEAVYDEEGNRRSRSFIGYSLLTAAEMPPVDTAFVESPSPLNPLGAKESARAARSGPRRPWPMRSPTRWGARAWIRRSPTPSVAGAARGRLVKPVAFDYRAPSLAEEALPLLGLESAVLAGGQSLVPLLNLRLARPSLWST